jgi:hypothetical protein
MKVCIVGNSHLWALWAAWRERGVEVLKAIIAEFDDDGIGVIQDLSSILIGWIKNIRFTNRSKSSM